MTLRQHIRGITLIELMIVVVIIGVLASIAYPSYRAHVQRAKRTEAISALMQIATEQERVYLNENTYTADLTKLGFPVADDYVTETGTYRVEVTAADADTFTATATYLVGDDEAGKCGVFSITAAGVKASAPSPDCWSAAQ
jgi:type IV pilus assembly protein PilE